MLLGGCRGADGGSQTRGHHQDKVLLKEHGSSAGGDRDARIPCWLQGMSGESVGPHLVPARFPGDSKSSTLCEMVAAEPGQGLSCPRAVSQGCCRSFSRWSLHWCQRQLPPFRLQSCGPETPCDITCCSPRHPELQLGTGHPDAGGHISPHCCPPIPAMP